MLYKTKLIKPPKPGDDQNRYPNGNTADIVETVLFADSKSDYYTHDFAKTLKAKTLIETCKNIWEFVKTQIPYVLDPAGEQWIKSPGRLWQEKAGDCKSFSVFTASCLKNLGIPYGYRFASYHKTDSTATHVYVYVPIGNKEIILDSVWTGPFNTQKQYTFKEDKLMSKIAYLGAIAAPAKHLPGEFRLTKNIDELTDGEMTLLIARQRLEVDKANSAAVGGPFNWQIEKYDKAIGVINHALANVNNPDEILRMADHFTNQALHNNKPAHVGGFLKKIGKGIKKVAKAVTKVVTLPMRLIAKGILEIYLPKAAPMFLYLFADEKVLPDKMKSKRKKAEKFKNFIVKKIGMKDAHFMGLVRNSLTKKYGQSPETYLANAIKNVAIKGIGNIGAAKRKVNKQRMNVSKKMMPVTTSSASLRSGNGMNIDVRKTASAAAQYAAQNQPAKVEKGEGLNKVLSAGNNLASGNIIGAIIDAIGWIISKLGGKKEGIEIGVDDLPDIDADLGNAISKESRETTFAKVPEAQMDIVKEELTKLIENNATLRQAQASIQEKLPFLKPAEQAAALKEVGTGFEVVEPEEAKEIAADVKKQSPGTGMCNC